MSSSLASLSDAFRPWAEWIVELAKYADASVRVTSAFRTHAKQQELYKAFREGRSRYPAARPGSSAHEYGYAIDLVFSNADARDVVRNIWTSYGGNLGNDDEIHFEFPNWRSFITPDQVQAETAPSPQDRTRTSWETAADSLLSFAPVLGYIVNIASIANALYAAASGQESTALYYASNPAEFWNDLPKILPAWVLQAAGWAPFAPPEGT